MNRHLALPVFLWSASLMFLAPEAQTQSNQSVITLEGETLKILAKTGAARPQDLRNYGVGRWSNDSHLWWTGAKPGEVLSLAFSVPTDGYYRLAAGFTKASDYGVFDVSLNGTLLYKDLDLYNGSVIHTGTLPIGDPVHLATGEHRLEFSVKGAHPSARKAYMLGLDYLLVAPSAVKDLASLGPKLAPSGAPAAKPGALKGGNAVDAKPLSPNAQRESFTLPSDFSIELVASEETGLPKPITVTFDDAGRMWSVTATEYPRDKDPVAWTKPGRDKVVVFDTPTARTPQTPRVFADGMVMPTGVLPHGNGAFIAQGPELFFLNDTDGDGKADGEKRVLAQGFGVQDTHTVPHQLEWHPGGRIVFSQGVLTSGRVTDAGGASVPFNRTLVATIRPDGKDLQVISAGLNNIWCWGHSRTGRVFIHEANDLGYSVVPFEEDSTYPSFIATKLNPLSPIHPPTAEGLGLGGTGFSGLALSEDTSGGFPAPWQGLLYIANPIHGKIHAVSASRDAKGIWKFSKHADLVVSSDPMFRPVAITFGPDGCLYITDWYNRIISHNEVARDHPARDKERGRVWRVRHKSQSDRLIPNLTKVADNELPAHLSAPSVWQMRAAWHQIGARKATHLAPELVAIAGKKEGAPSARIHAVWALAELGHFDAALWKSLLADADDDVRRESVRALDLLRIPPSQAFALLKPLSAETAWPVRYAVLRYFRHANTPRDSEQAAWLKKWSEAPAPTEHVKGWGGTYLALGGSYERAFQDFLLELALSGKPAAELFENRWDKAIGTEPPPAAEAVARLKHRIETIKPLVAKTPPEQGRAMTESLCLACHVAGGKGVALAPPLDGSSKRDLDGLLTAILAPNEAIEQAFRLFRIETKSGGTLEGFKKREDAKEVTVLLMGGIEQKIAHDEIKSAGYITGRSVMPPVAEGMSDEQVAAIAAFLRTLP